MPPLATLLAHGPAYAPTLPRAKVAGIDDSADWSQREEAAAESDAFHREVDCQSGEKPALWPRAQAVSAGARQPAEHVCPAVRDTDADRARRHDHAGSLHLAGYRYELAIHEFRVAVRLDAAAVEHTVHLGDAYFELEGFGAAAKAFERALLRDPQSARLHWKLAQAHLGHSKLFKALAAAQRALELDPTAPAHHHCLGLVLHNLEQYEESTQQLRETIAMDDRSPEYLCHAGLAMLLQKDQEVATRVLRGGAGLHPTDPHLHLALAMAHVKAGNVEEGTATYRKACQLHEAAVASGKRRWTRPGVIAMWYEHVAWYCCEQKDYAGARAACEVAIAADENQAHAHWQLGDVLMTLGGEDEAAVEHLRAAAALGRERALYHNLLGVGLLRLEGGLAAAVASIRRAVACAGGKHRALYHSNLARALTQEGKFVGAAESYGDAIAADPLDPSHHDELGVLLLYKFNEPAAAAEEFRRAVETAATAGGGALPSPVHHFNLGVALHKSGEPGAALRALERAAALDDSRGAYHNWLGFVAEELGQLERAEAAFERAIEVGSDGDSGCPAEYSYNLGHLLHRTGRPKRALELLQAAAAAAPSKAAYASMVGRVHLGLEEWALAEAQFARAAKLEPSVAAYHDLRGDALLGFGKAREALAAYDSAIMLDGRQAHMYDSLGRCWWDLGAYDSALKAFESAIAIDGSQPVYHTNRGVVLAECNRYSDALEAGRRAIELAGGAASSRHGLGQILERCGEWTAAVEAFEAAVALDGGRAAYHASLGKAYCRRRQFGKALAPLSRALEADLRSGTPPPLSTRYCKAVVHYELGGFWAAAAEVEAAQEATAAPPLASELAHVLTVLGLAQCRQGRFGPGVAALAQAATLEGALPAYHVNLGVARLEVGDTAGAQAALTAARSLLSEVELLIHFAQADERDLHTGSAERADRLELAVGLRVLAVQYRREHGEKYRELQDCFRGWVYGTKDPWYLAPYMMWGV